MEIKILSFFIKTLISLLIFQEWVVEGLLGSKDSERVEAGESVVLVKEPKPGWVRFCSDENRYDVFSNQCSAGFFWKPDFKVDDKSWDCVCTRGA